MNLLRRLAARLPSRTIEHYGDPYLTRHTVLRLGRLLRMYLHEIHREDSDEEHHSHPWKLAVAVVLRGGYTEERLTDGTVKRRRLRPGSINVLRASTYHRIAALHGETWTLFLPFGRNSGAWSFEHPLTGERTPWREFVKRQRRSQ